jgi:hypothetical protein
MNKPYNNKIYFILALMLISSVTYGNGKKVLKSIKAKFEKVIGGRSYDAASSAVLLKDGSFLVAGRSSSFGSSSDGLLVKLGSDGQEIWQKTYGDDQTEEISDVIETSDGNYLIVGHSDSYNYAPDMNDMWAVKIKPNGDEIWNVVIESEETIDEAESVVETSDGGFVMVGTRITTIEDATSSVMAVKIDSEGEMVWEKYYGGDGNEQGTCIVATSDGFTITGNTESYGEGKWDIWVLHIDNEGAKMWDFAYGGKNNEMSNRIINTSDGGYLFSGYSYSFAEGSLDAWVVKIDSKGTQQWAKNFGGLSTDEAFGIVEMSDLSFVLGGYTEVYEPDEDFVNISKEGHNMFIIKLKANGDKVWERSLGGTGNQKCFDLITTKDGGLLSVGTTDSNPLNGIDAFIVTLSSEGSYK